MIILKLTSESLQLTSSTATPLDVSVSFVDITTTTFAPSSNEVKVTTTGATAILAAPAASTQRQIKLVTISNTSTTISSNITVQKLITATTYNMTPVVTLLPGETMQYMDGNGWMYYSASGAIKGTVTAGGATNQVQFNTNGILTGDSDLTWNSTTNTLALGTSPQIVMSAVTATPATPASGNLTLYSQAVSGKMELMKVGPAGDAEALQAALWQNNTVIWTPGIANGVFQGTAGSFQGTATVGTTATTNLYTVMRKSLWASVVTTANQQLGVRTENMFYRGAVAGMGGFLFVCRFGLTTWTAGSRLFIGLSANTNTTTGMVSVEPSTVASSVGFSIGAAETAITFLHTDGTPTATKDAIAGQPALAANNGYDAYIYCRPNDSTVYYRLDNALTGATLIDSSTTTTLPVNTTALAGFATISNGANTAVNAATLGLNRMYIETNR